MSTKEKESLKKTELPPVIGAPQWLKDRHAALRKLPPPTLEHVRTAWSAPHPIREDIDEEIRKKGYLR